MMIMMIMMIILRPAVFYSDLENVKVCQFACLKGMNNK